MCCAGHEGCRGTSAPRSCDSQAIRGGCALAVPRQRQKTLDHSAAPLQNTRQTDLVGSLGLKSDRLLALIHQAQATIKIIVVRQCAVTLVAGAKPRGPALCPPPAQPFRAVTLYFSRSNVWLTNARNAGARTGLTRKPQPRSAAWRRSVASRSAVTRITAGLWPQRWHSSAYTSGPW